MTGITFLTTLKVEEGNRFMYKCGTQDDRKVLPYNAGLITNYQCHINVDRT